MNAQLRLVEFPRWRIDAMPSLTPFLKWPGGKTQELPAIAAAAPELTGRYIDPFVGGGSVLLAIPENVPAWANDAAEDLIDVYRAAASQRGDFREALVGLADTWDQLAGLDGLYRRLADAFLAGSLDLVVTSTEQAKQVLEGVLQNAGPGLVESFFARLTKDLPTKFNRMRVVQADVGKILNERDLLANVEGAVRSAFYMSVRARYNRARQSGGWDDLRTADFLFLREFAYAAMFRFNSRGEFNVPYGGISYNRKSLNDKVALLFSPDMLSRLENTEWRRGDFEPFLHEAAPASDDFVFIDPPYDSDFSAYDNMSFGWWDQERLRNTLEAIPASVMIVIKDTPMIRRLYRSDRWRVAASGKTYMWTIKSRNDREATHLTITNY